MKTINIEFVGDISFNYSSYKKRVESLIIKLISDNKSNYSNYSISEDGTYLIPIIRDLNWKNDKSLFVDFENESNTYMRKYIRINAINELNYGLSFYDKSYFEFFISDEYYDKHSDLMERKMMNWLDGKESFIKSLYVQKYKYLVKHLFWSEGNICFPDNLYIDFKTNFEIRYNVIEKFYTMDYTLDRLNKFFKLMI